ncbi:MAG: phosphoribosylglycinamide formyltransferase, phosphoribosylglycinamide formyltransferase 1 [Candidatus Taylorbacteria bacterium]|nr:phosphoribosylglycinamide formyltransferase, phosphoribosylglycinamide formyltransferase 1 [Candidatus Taylorbacteria bacterium]
MRKPKLLIFASGSKDGGGSGFQKLCEASQNGVLSAEIVGVVSNHENGGVKAKAAKFNIPFIYSPKGRAAEDYKRIYKETGADFVALSGWLGFVEGLPPEKTFNIHPAFLPSQFGGTGFYGHHIHEAVIDAYKKGELTYTGVTMHFVTDTYDDPNAIFFRRKVEILPDDTAETLFARVNALEHKWQPIITNRIVNGEISWDGKNPESMRGADIEK